MASIRKRGERWQAQVRRMSGFKASRSFIMRADAERWARETEIQADRQTLHLDAAQPQRLSVGNILMRYRNTITPKKRSAVKEDRMQSVTAAAMRLVNRRAIGTGSFLHTDPHAAPDFTV